MSRLKRFELLRSFSSSLLVLLRCFMPYTVILEQERPLTERASQMKAVNLGGWLVTEGWIKPSLFDGIPNKDF